jgi:hypothetical protein
MIYYLVLMEEHVTFWSLANPISFWVNMDFSKEASSDYHNSFTNLIIIFFKKNLFKKLTSCHVESFKKLNFKMLKFMDHALHQNAS